MSLGKNQTQTLTDPKRGGISDILGVSFFLFGFEGAQVDHLEGTLLKDLNAEIC